MSPPATPPATTGYLEHPAEAFAYFRSEGVRAGGVRGEAHGLAGGRGRVPRRGAARRRFGVGGRATGACYTRTGRSFFDDAGLGEAFLDRVRAAVRGRALGRAVDIAGCCWTRADALVVQGRRSSSNASTRRSARRPAAAFARGRVALAPRRPAESTRRRCWPTLERGRRRRGGSSMPTGTTAGRSGRLETSAGARSRSSPTEGNSLADATTAGISVSLARWPARTRVLLRATRIASSRSTIARRSAERHRLVEELTAAGGEGMVVKPVDSMCGARRVRSRRRMRPPVPGVPRAPNEPMTAGAAIDGRPPVVWSSRV